MEDKELDYYIKSFKKTGDNSAYEKIYRYYFAKIYRFALLNISDHQAAEDIAIDVFYKVYSHLRQINLDYAAFKAWIYRIARNLVIDFYRKHSSKSDISLQQYIEETHAGECEAEVFTENDFGENNIFPCASDLSEEEGFSNPALLKGLEKLPEIQKQVIILRYVEELDYRSIGKIIGKSEISVRAIKFRAISKLKELLFS